MSKKEDTAEEEFQHLVRVGGRDIKGQKNVVHGLTLIRGIGSRTARIVCTGSKVDFRKKIGYLKDSEIEAIEVEINALESAPPWILNRQKDYATGRNRQVTGANLMLSLRDDLNRLRKIRSYRGIRHESGLPVRGQRTKSSFRKNVTVGVSRKKVRVAQSK